MAEAILLRNLPEGLGKVYVWKKYTLQENVSYTWNRWSVVEAVTYKWEKWSTEMSQDKKVIIEYGSFSDEEYKNDGTGAWSSSRLYCTYFTTSSDPIAWNNGTYESNFIFSDSTQKTVELTSDTYKYIPGWTSRSGMRGSNVYITELFYRPYFASIGIKRSSDWLFSTKYRSASRRATYSTYPIKGSTSYGQVTSTNSSAYPSNGASGSYWYVSAGSDTSYSKGSTSYPDVSSTSDSAYPNPGHQDGYWYENRQEVITYSMGSYIEDVFSTNPQRYPTNGMDGAYWYVLQS